jgi:hypothetical protein
LRRSIDEIRSCKQAGALKRLFTDARVLELIMYQLEHFSQSMDDEEDVLQDENIIKQSKLKTGDLVSYDLFVLLRFLYLCMWVLLPLTNVSLAFTTQNTFEY